MNEGGGDIQVCLPPPDVPTGTPGRATLGAKLYSAELTIANVFSVNTAGTVASPAQVASGAVTAAARTRGKGATVSGTVRQGGQFVLLPREDRRVFRANASAATGAAPAVCSALSAAIAPVPCVNPTTSGFTAQSRVVRKR